MGVALSQAACRERGLSLIELMVAVLLGSLLMVGMIQIFVATKVSYMTQTGQAYLHESGRFALEYAARDVRMAGLMGCTSRNNVPVTSYLDSVSFEFDFSQGVRGYEYAGTAPGETFPLPGDFPAVDANAGSWSPALPAGIVGNVVSGSDVLVVRSIGDAPIPLVAPFTSGNQVFAETVSGLEIGDILLVTDCQQAQIFQATNISDSSNNIVGGVAGQFTPGNSSNINARGPVTNFGPGTEIARISTIVYYVGLGANGVPALFRMATARTGPVVGLQAEELVGGVESMQLLFGVDTTNNFSTDAYVPASGVTDWNRVVAVRMALLLRTPDEYGTQVDADTYSLGGTVVNPPNDRHQRRVFTKTIALRNRML
ncbi:MAG TPA: PilW family protein [Xanthomonadaceae bacterium]|nr:PilW family protein [Xanthomonadaceae bacterium]